MVGWNETISSNFNAQLFVAQDDDWRNEFILGNEILIDNLAGGGLFVPHSNQIPDFYYPNLKLLGQFTTEPPGPYGTINLSFSKPLQNNQFDIALRTLTFGPENIQILGCTNSLSLEFNPEATFDDGTCSPPGDFTGDGDITIEDLMILISEFGCLLDCQGSDMNNDGIVNVADIIIFLEFI